MNKLFFPAVVIISLLAACLVDTKKESDDTIANRSAKKVSKSTIPVANDDVINFATMESPPRYPGGMRAFYNFIGTNLNYPTAAMENNIQGQVLMSFIIEKDGTLTNVQVDRKLGSGTDEEAVRVLKLSKNWSPGIADGKAVRVKYNIPIKFSLSNQ